MNQPQPQESGERRPDRGERRWTIHVCPTLPPSRVLFPLDCNCGPGEGERVEVVPASDLDQALARVGEVERRLGVVRRERNLYEQRAEENRADALANLDALELHRRHRAQAEQTIAAVGGELERIENEAAMDPLHRPREHQMIAEDLADLLRGEGETD